MPHPDYRIQAHVCVACRGPEEAPTIGHGPRGKFHSKSQTTLRYAVDDVRAWAAHFQGGEHDEEDVVKHYVVLESATAGALQDAIADAIDRLDFHFEDSAGGSLNFVFSGHGAANGDLVLADDRLVSPDELMEWCAGGRAGDNGKTRHLRTAIDSCYSGLTLCRLVMHPHHGRRAVVRDGFAACLPSEEAFELRSLRHSVLTYTMLRPGTRLLLKRPLTAEEFKEVKASVRETTEYLTNGKQHSLDIINGHAISQRGSANRSVEVLDNETLDELVEAVNSLPRRRPRAG
jgi:hypothetical protein